VGLNAASSKLRVTERHFQFSGVLLFVYGLINIPVHMSGYMVNNSMVITE
jgi:hypothetical protein